MMRDMLQQPEPEPEPQPDSGEFGSPTPGPLARQSQEKCEQYASPAQAGTPGTLRSQGPLQNPRVPAARFIIFSVR